MDSEDAFQFEIAFCEAIYRRAPKDLPTMEMLAGFYTRVGRIADGLKLDRKIVRLDPQNPVGHYNLACSLSLLKQFKPAFEALRKALDNGYADYRWLFEDPDLEPLRKHRQFSELLTEFKIKN